MKTPRIIETKDKSHTLYNVQLDEHYHSVNGAIQESMHVFVNAGFNSIKKEKISVLEIGFGTGLNAFLTLIEGKKKEKRVEYTSLELYPVALEKVILLNYTDILGYKNEFIKLHSSEWGIWQKINSTFKLKKLQIDLELFKPKHKYDLIYFDAFSPKVQPELWGSEIFGKLTQAMNSEAILTTYSAKGTVRRILMECGLKVERIPGPPGKREMIRAIMDRY